MKVTTIDRTTVRLIRTQLDQILADHGIEGVQVKVGHGSFTSGNVTFKLEVALQGDNGEVRTKEWDDWKRYASSFGLPLDAIGKTVTLGGEQVKIVGLKPRSYRYPVLCERVRDGKRFKYGEAMIGPALERSTA